ncbi:MAG: putative transposase [Burkholderiales bacterium]|jgi:hypothetical protein|nr:putative transposase [Burkholderiales bacterium]
MPNTLRDMTGFLDFFESVPDHRINRKKLYSVGEILLLTFCALVCGCKSWDDIEFFGVLRLEFLRKYLPYANDTPSDDTLRFFRVLDLKVSGMNIFLKNISLQYKGSKLIIVLDGASWHRSAGLVVPENISIIHLPPYSPELNPVERLWNYLKSNLRANFRQKASKYLLVFLSSADRALN